jgi:hypothetical protein
MSARASSRASAPTFTSEPQEHAQATRLASITAELGGDEVLTLILLIIAAACFAAATVNVPTRVNLVALGLLAWILTAILPHL